MKYRFIEETDSSPQIGSFPLIEVPTGNENNQLGAGHIQAYLPLWIQKTWGKLTTYGGGGVWFSTGPGRGHWIFTGWELQYDFSEWITLGNEFYFQTAETQSAESSTGFNFGGNINITERHHVLFSVGRTFSGEMSVTGYIGYQLTM
jgi:hypothetical protein